AANSPGRQGMRASLVVSVSCRLTTLPSVPRHGPCKGRRCRFIRVRRLKMQIQGSSILITGASRGLGAALARALARRGGRIVLAAGGREALERVAAEIRAVGGEAHAVPADVGAKDAIYPLAGAAQALVGPIDILIHAAADLGPVPLRALADTDCEDL